VDEAKLFKQRPNIGSRVTREGHARFWERPEVQFLRATRRECVHQIQMSLFLPFTNVTLVWVERRADAEPPGVAQRPRRHERLAGAECGRRPQERCALVRAKQPRSAFRCR